MQDGTGTNGADGAALDLAGGGRLAGNIVRFGRILRRAGLPVGPGQVLDALDAAQAGCLSSRTDFYWMLHAVFVRRREHHAIFDRAFRAFWRRPAMLERFMKMFLQEVRRPPGNERKRAGDRRLAEAMFDEPEARDRPDPPSVVDVDASQTFSAREVLRNKDFEQMSSDEQADARRAIAALRKAALRVSTRRFRPSSRGSSVDMRRTLRAAARSGSGLADLKRRDRATREPPLVILCDISGSMSGYTRMFLHFLHALATDRSRVQVFLFGTRLTNITRALKLKDVDDAVDEVTGQARDWSGGTRIGPCLREFNRDWSRRVLAQGAHVLLISDGLDRDDGELLEHQIAHLGRAARRLVWLNPLLRFEGFEARSRGIRTILGHVDEFRPVHSLACLEDLAKSLTCSGRAEHDPRRWLRAAA